MPRLLPSGSLVQVRSRPWAPATPSHLLSIGIEAMSSWLDLSRRHAFAGMFQLVMLVSGSWTLATEPPYFETEIRPILREYCFDCHGAVDEMEGGLDLRLVHFMTSGGESGPALELGNPEASLLLMRIRDGEMPPGETKVPQEKIATLEKWILLGAPTRRAEP